MSETLAATARQSLITQLSEPHSTTALPTPPGRLTMAELMVVTMLREAGGVVTYREIFDAIRRGGPHHDNYVNNVRVIIFKVRRKLGAVVQIENIPGCGYAMQRSST